FDILRLRHHRLDDVAHQVGVVVHRYGPLVAAAVSPPGEAAAGSDAPALAAAAAASAFEGLVGRFLADSFGTNPRSMRKARAVSDGRAPFFSQALTFSWSMLSLTGSVIGSKVPRISMNLPSRGERVSATTSR